MIMSISRSSITPQDSSITNITNINTHLMQNKESLSESISSSPESTPVSATALPSTFSSPPLISTSSPLSSSEANTCGNCGTSKTPLWRRTADGLLTCNACGLYYKANNSHRPVNLKRPPTVVPISVRDLQSGSCEGDGKCNGTGGTSSCKGCPAFNNRVLVANKNSLLITKRDGSPTSENQNLQPGEIDESADSLAVACSNCGTTVTPLWRRDGAGNTICNACGLYYKMHGSHRPVVMKKATIKRRKRTLNTTDTPIIKEVSFDTTATKKKKKVKPNRLSSPVTIVVNPLNITEENADTIVTTHPPQVKAEGIINANSKRSPLIPVTMARPSLNNPSIKLPGLSTSVNNHMPILSNLSSDRIPFQLPRPETSSYLPQNITHQHHTLPPLRYMENSTHSQDSAKIENISTRLNNAPPAIDFTSTFMNSQEVSSSSPLSPAQSDSPSSAEAKMKVENNDNSSRANSSKMSVSLLLNTTKNNEEY